MKQTSDAEELALLEQGLPDEKSTPVMSTPWKSTPVISAEEN